MQIKRKKQDQDIQYYIPNDAPGNYTNVINNNFKINNYYNVHFQIKMSAQREVTTVTRPVPTLSAPSPAHVGVDTHWPAMADLALVCCCCYHSSLCIYVYVYNYFIAMQCHWGNELLYFTIIAWKL